LGIFDMITIMERFNEKIEDLKNKLLKIEDCL